MSNIETVNDRIRTIFYYFRGSSKYTQKDFANLIGVLPARVNHIFKDQNKPDSSFLEKVALAFPDINTTWLLTGQGSMLQAPASPSSEQEVQALKERILDLEHDVAEREKLLIQYKQRSDWANKHPWRALWSRITFRFLSHPRYVIVADPNKPSVVFRTRQQAEAEKQDSAYILSLIESKNPDRRKMAFLRFSERQTTTLAVASTANESDAPSSCAQASPLIPAPVQVQPGYAPASPLNEVAEKSLPLCRPECFSPIRHSPVLVPPTRRTSSKVEQTSLCP